ncbi:hypothetical protein JVU11DRAFT_7053 [Chiua virens]|nr:hypothetical protein JVU11DRAFT_7053 [Chiua virens]
MFAVRMFIMRSFRNVKLTVEFEPCFPSYSGGVNVPGVRLVDAENGCLGLEFIEGPTVRHIIPAGGD